MACFVAGTLVLRADGLEEIEDLEAGELIWSINPETGEWGWQEVETPLARLWQGDLVSLSVAQDEIETTGNHPFWVLSGDALASRPEVHELAKVHEDGVQGRWVEALHLRVGDWLLLRSGEWAKVRAFSSRIAATYVYNATVANWHTYSVGRSGILVHNAKCPKKLRGSNHPVTKEAIARGKKKHEDFAETVSEKEGWISNPRGLRDPKTGRVVKPDALDPKGRPVELKPRTESGVRRGKKQLEKYERATGKRGRVVYYD